MSQVRTSPPNQRRHPRQTITQSARLISPGVGEIACILRNVCPGGFYLSPVSFDTTWQAFQRANPQLDVELLIHLREGVKPIRLAGRIAHRSDLGAGFASHREIPKPLLLALQRASNRPTPRLLRSGVQALHQACLKVLAQWWPETQTRFFDQLPDILGDAADRAMTNQERYDLLEAIAELKQRRPSLEADLTARIARQAERFAEPLDTTAEPDTDVPNLSLLDKTAFEDWLALNEISARLETAWKASLDAQNQPLSQIAGKPITWKNNPFGPWMLGQALRETLGAHEFDPAIKQLAYQAFGLALRARLDALYDPLRQVLEVLIRAPEGKAIVRPVRSGVRAAPVAPAETGEQTSSLPVKTHTSSVTAPAAVAPASSARTGVLKAARSLLALQDALHPSEAPGANESKAVPRRVGTETSGNADAGDSVTTVLFQTMLQQSTLPETLVTLFAPLQDPLAAITAVDPQALERHDHPVREFINLLEHLVIATDRHGEIEIPALARSVGRILQQVAREGASHPSIFSEAKDQLAQLTAPLLHKRSARLERLQQTYEARQRLEAARQLVEHAIADRLQGQMVPKVVLELLDAGWRQLLLLTALREGMDSPSWQSLWAVIEKLLSWLAPEAITICPPSQDAHRLINWVEEQLWTLGFEPVAHKTLIDELTALLIGAGPDHVRLSPVYEAFRPDRLGEELKEKLATFTSEEPWLNGLKVGDWLMFSDCEGHCSSLRLSWMGRSLPLLVFTDQKGHKARELAPGELADLFREKRVRRIESLEQPWLDRATNDFMESLRERLRYQAIHDPVSGLINRKEFIRQVEHRLAPYDGSEPRLVLCVVEIDLLNTITNLCGLEAGEQVLKDVARALGDALGKGDVLARIGDTQFGVLFINCDESEGVQRAEGLLTIIRAQRFTSEKHSFTLGGVIGLTSCNVIRDSAHALVQRADAAFQAARERGRNQIQVYRVHDTAVETRISLMSWAGQIDKLLTEGRLFARVQLIAPLFPEREAHSHYEVLLGIRADAGELTSPQEFIRAAEYWKRMPDIDLWQVESVFRWIRQNRERFNRMGGFAINLSGQSINSGEFLESLQQRLFEADWPKEKITFEITETAALDGFAQAQKFIRQIKRLGCRFSLDDFGSGFSSYAYLKNLNVDYLKIDGSFVKDLMTSETDYVMVKSMNEIGHSLGLKTIAEYVENDAIAEKLHELGVDFAQGYGIGKPVPIEHLA